MFGKVFFLRFKLSLLFLELSEFAFKDSNREVEEEIGANIDDWQEPNNDCVRVALSEMMHHDRPPVHEGGFQNN